VEVGLRWRHELTYPELPYPSTRLSSSGNSKITRTFRINI
jgi:hypothetical protein